MKTLVAAIPWLALLITPVAAADANASSPNRAAVEAALRKAATFYSSEVAHHGGYVYYYSLDLEQCWGEGKTTRDVIWVQPPGTPTVGMAYLRAYEATGDAFYLDAARAAADALVYGQLDSGGWTNRVCFAPCERMGKYRNGRGDDWNQTSLDDGQTQSALRFLIQTDEALRFSDPKIHAAVEYALAALLAHQFPNGAFAQGWDEEALPDPRPRPARYPRRDWRELERVKNYWDLYTLNDDNAVYLVDVLLEAIRVYKRPEHATSLARLGDFLIQAQMPQPQPAWAQQYTYDMRPAWARPFEPPAISSRESMGVMEALIKIHHHTGERKFLRPIAPALDYLRRSLLPDGRLARYYELKTNRPLYMVRRPNKQYVPTYDDADLPAHYAWKVKPRLDAIEEAYRQARRNRPPPTTPRQLDRDGEVRKILAELDARGRWISTATRAPLVGQPRFRPGQRYIASAVFAENVETLSAYLCHNP
jgi:hypothetical protein